MNYSEFLIDTDKYCHTRPCMHIKRMTEEELCHGGRIYVCHIPCAWGEFLVAATDKGICRMAITNNRDSALIKLRSQFHAFSILPAEKILFDQLTTQIHSTLRGEPAAGLQLHLQCSDFQHKIYESLLRIPYGYLASYTQVATMAGFPKALRAAGTAIGKNPVAILIPCHRVIPADGSLGNYHYGPAIKQELVSLEIRKHLHF